jgi:hypothetical protein
MGVGARQMLAFELLDTEPDDFSSEELDLYVEGIDPELANGVEVWDQEAYEEARRQATGEHAEGWIEVDESAVVQTEGGLEELPSNGAEDELPEEGEEEELTEEDDELAEAEEGPAGKGRADEDGTATAKAKRGGGGAASTSASAGASAGAGAAVVKASARGAGRLDALEEPKRAAESDEGTSPVRAPPPRAAKAAQAPPAPKAQPPQPVPRASTPSPAPRASPPSPAPRASPPRPRATPAASKLAVAVPAPKRGKAPKAAPKAAPPSRAEEPSRKASKVAAAKAHEHGPARKPKASGKQAAIVDFGDDEFRMEASR